MVVYSDLAEKVVRYLCCAVCVQVLEKAGKGKVGRAQLAKALRKLTGEPEAVGPLLGGLDVVALLAEEA